MRFDIHTKINVKRSLSSSILFTSGMVVSALSAIFLLFAILFIVARLDAAFFEANGMVQNDTIREAFYYQVFEFEPAIWGMLFAGFTAVVLLSFLFCKSQFDYYRHMAGALRFMADTGDTPPTTLLGRFNPYATYFFEVLSRRLNGETEEALDSLIGRASKAWPPFPRISWIDQVQFAAVSGVLGLFFSAVCMIVYLKVAGRVVEVGQSVAHFTTTSGPMFLTEQFKIVDSVVWVLLILLTLSFVRTGYRFGSQIAEADYAIIRDLKDFMEGNFRKRLFLRSDDPAHEYILAMNDSLDRISNRVRNPGAKSPAESGSPGR